MFQKLINFPHNLLLLALCSFISSVHATVTAYFDSIKTDPNALYAFFKAMPKGGELHYHLAGGAYPETMLSLAQGNYCLNTSNMEITKSKKTCDGVTAANLPPTLYPKVIRSWSMKDFIEGTESGHDHFFGSFLKFYPIVENYQPQLLAEVMERASSQNEFYLEIMVMPDNANSASFAPIAKGPIGFSAKQRSLLSNKGFQKNIQTTIYESKRILKDARIALGCDALPTQPVCQITVKFQYHVLREQSLDKVFAQALNGFAAAQQSDDIVGINLVQPEDGIISMRDYEEQMRIFNYLHVEYPNVHIALHAGELTNNEVPPEKLSSHIHDAIFKGHAERIGHGVDISHENGVKKLISHMATTPIPVEINLTSNKKILHISGRDHPLNYYLANHVPVVLSTDDEGILRTDLSHEYVIAVLEHGLGYDNIKTINRNALTYSFLPGKSLWANPRKHVLVDECREFNSKECQQFIKENEKAKIQWRLEKQLKAFEEKM